jgi:DNA-binding transcriptional LysR family regulator
MGVAVLPREAVAPHLRSMQLREIQIEDEWSHRRLLIALRNANAVARHVRLLIDHLCEPPVRADVQRRA